ncbi:MAG: TIGR03560 family F420-dependent LLM class oxidoreductase [Anaerolineae bacterium]|nr:TIGR03560 family F420-dependent LLM class oxidoreductase [Anaerolineae bacterium]
MTFIGLMIEGQWGLTWERWRRLIEAADTMGYQCVFRSDHYTIGPPDDDSLETFISLTYAADHTKHIEFGPLVAPTTFRHPALTARMASQIDDLSGGRMVLGLGTGWHEREHKQFGIPFYDQLARYEMLEDALEITTRLYHADEPVNYGGTHYSLDGAVLLPRPSRAGGPPILIGGNGPKRTLPLAAKYADEWNGVHINVNMFKERGALLDELLEKNGRDKAAVKRSVMLPCIIGKDDADLRTRSGGEMAPSDSLLERKKIIGTPSQIVEHISKYQEAGAYRLILMWQDQEDLAGIELLAKEVLPHFHQLR